MDTTNNWQSWQPKDDDLENLLQPGFANRLQPHHPLLKLKRNLYINTVWGILITVVYCIIIIRTSIWPVQLALGITSVFNIVILVQAIQLYRSIRTNISSTDSVLDIMKNHHREISAWCSMQHKLALWVYPVAATGGYIYGGALSSGKSFEELFAEPVFLWALPVTLVVLVPVSHFAAKWLTRKTFGVHLDMLKSTIRTLEGLV
ncbi:hypothetical protein [Flavihumibacter fluvii]|uniref:hypothetical protein n=1 Tax=Flavihumibacter fluvii TaxID=2838157 RepID=UPI001BDF5584|nr:hypothetical protein [Flavihumibacter fluvii]ULQ52250.1 hypothetical protein KJS93_19355 [Flavihumibacter fluvii]